MGVPGGDEIAAFDLRTGAPRWTYRTVGEDVPSAVYEGGRSIFANGDWRLLAVCTPDIDHTYAVALNPSSGKILW